MAKLHGVAKAGQGVIDAALKGSKSGGTSGIFGLVGKGIVGGAETTVNVAKQPLIWGLNLVAGLVGSARNVIVKHPRFAIGAAAAAGGAWLLNENDKKNRAQAAAQIDELQQAQAAQPNYKNSASYADVEAAIAADRAVQGQAAAPSHAANVVAARTQVNAPESAAVTQNI